MRLGRRGATVDLSQLVLGAIMILVIAVIGFAIIGSIEKNITLTGLWNKTYASFQSSVSGVFPLIATALVVMVASAIIAILIGVLGGGQ